MIAATLLPKLHDWTPTGAGPHALSAQLANGWTASIAAERVESLGCRATEIELQRPERPASAAELTEWAVRSAQRVTGLLEPLKVIEVDATRSEAILRSESPAVCEDKLQYYELQLRGTHAAKLRRYEASRSASQRHAVPFALTHEAIAKLAEDLTAE